MCAESRPDRVRRLLEGYMGWWADLAHRRSENTVRLYRGCVARLLAHVPPAKIADMAEVRPYLDTMRPQYQRTFRSALTDLYDYLVRHGFLSHNPLKTQRQFRRRGRTKIHRSLNDEQITRLLITLVYVGVGNVRWSGTRLGWGVLANYETGLRPGEFVDLHVDDVHLSGALSEIHVTETKTGNDRIVPLNRVAREALEELMRDRTGLVFGIGRTQYWTHVSRCARIAGIDPRAARPYALRHSFARGLIERGVSERDVQELLGHSDIRSLGTYTHPPKSALRRAVRKLEKPTQKDPDDDGPDLD